MRSSFGLLLLLVAAGAYADYLLRAEGPPEWDNVVIGDVGSGGSGGLPLELGGGDPGPAPGFSFSGSGSGTPFSTVR